MESMKRNGILFAGAVAVLMASAACERTADMAGLVPPDQHREKPECEGNHAGG